MPIQAPTQPSPAVPSARSLIRPGCPFVATLPSCSLAHCCDQQPPGPEQPRSGSGRQRVSSAGFQLCVRATPLPHSQKGQLLRPCFRMFSARLASSASLRSSSCSRRRSSSARALAPLPLVPPLVGALGLRRAGVRVAVRRVVVGLEGARAGQCALHRRVGKGVGVERGAVGKGICRGVCQQA
jgi:hypothetical protein